MNDPIPALSREQVRRVDAEAMAQLGMLGVVLMENAGRNAAAVLMDQFVGNDNSESAESSPRVVILCGTGNNGGDGFVVARHLLNAGLSVTTVLLGKRESLSPDAAANHDILVKSNYEVATLTDPLQLADVLAELGSTDWIVDGMLGTGIRGEVRSPMGELIRVVNRCKARVMALDLPSGMDCDSGQPCGVCVTAQETVTFVADKLGFQQPGAGDLTGNVTIADIGVPKRWLRALLDRKIVPNKN